MSFKVHFADISGWAAWFRVTGVRCVKAPCRFCVLSAGPWATVGHSIRRTTGPSTKRFALHTAFSVLKRLAGNKKINKKRFISNQLLNAKIDITSFPTVLSDERCFTLYSIPP